MSRYPAATVLRAFVASAVVLFAGCSSDDGTPNGPGTGGVSPTTGHFIDSPVQGLVYVSGTKTGTTGPDGKFRFESDTDVTFSLGDIQLGSGAAASVMSPLSLVLGAFDVTNATVTNLARFLQTIDDDANPNNGILITDAVRAAAAGRTVDFEQSVVAFENDANVQSVVSALTTATYAGERALVGASTAQAHLSGGLRAAYAGGYDGIFCQDVEGGGQVHAGRWDMDVGANGSVSMVFNGDEGFSDFEASGVMDIFGNVTITPPGPQIYAKFDPDFGGRWFYGETSGSFSETTDCTD